MKYLNGSELASFIKVRQAKQVRGLRQAENINPTLAIVRCDSDNPVIDMYVRLKKRYGADILIDVHEYNETPDTVKGRLDSLSDDDSVNGVIIQLPVEPADLTDELIELIPADKDVDGLRKSSKFDAATPVAIDWLLAGFGIDFANKKIAIVGAGKLVGSPLLKRWRNSGLDVTLFDKGDGRDLAGELPNYQIIVSATGSPGLITSDMLANGAIVVDAGVSVENGVALGDVASDVRQIRQDLTITPERGGVGPLTVAALFDNVILSARRKAQAKK
ncbi:bifunctional 5,10-methylenetetrahydrofolate dehydrogenase/5,10-methenyltetrahydrofolate cyclohydrolase [Candidatus Saccharibacteria bacterium]|jgi:methylenetetrahydrofolate dehydrogenase (NADP+)/methenyltetrahydrofolate cyclohydrolase|nr:bifunctional 5,10-methylenetetrahydrofolate dehydrogenase/5,10-methenyltetrahydrofolate cyclohydrolase [Candidatus Saccharibacteria bacterium]